MPTVGIPSQEAQILYSAVTFRYLLDSLARPGKLNRLADSSFLGEPPLAPTSASGSEKPVNLFALGAILTLLDREVSGGVIAAGQWLGPEAPALRWLGVRSGLRIVAPEEASFVLCCEGTSGGLLSRLSLGTLVEPENSATVLYTVERLATSGPPGPGDLRLRLSGPGIDSTQTVVVAGLMQDELKLIRATRQNYPLGLDVYLIDEAGLCLGLPRTTRIESLG